SLLETRAACCRNSNSQLGGQPWPSLAHSLSEWMSTKTRLLSPMWLKIMVLRSPSSELLAPARVTSINSHAKCNRRPPSALRLRSRSLWLLALPLSDEQRLRLLGGGPLGDPPPTRRSGQNRPPRRHATGQASPLGCSYCGRCPQGGRCSQPGSL